MNKYWRGFSSCTCRSYDSHITALMRICINLSIRGKREVSWTDMGAATIRNGIPCRAVDNESTATPGWNDLRVSATSPFICSDLGDTVGSGVGYHVDSTIFNLESEKSLEMAPEQQLTQGYGSVSTWWHLRRLYCRIPLL